MITVAFWGIMLALAILFPNILFLFFQPKDAPKDIKEESRILNTLEKVGQVGSWFFLSFDVGSYTFGFKTVTLGVFWIFSTIVLLALYYLLWIRYYVKGKKYCYLYDTVIIPIPMAIIPVCLFLFTGLLEQHYLLILFSIIFAIGHISINWYHYNLIK
ncbi:hypothetical protein JYG23_08045 [Sedimentibacter sp. zth1]|uniref:hypothetical protein n=1 Tax=Sedimentibacter sp. zth1 TaxID=2816908 RepID=UPI001A9264C6|nr:hypothetical protein [Sedimentibacter sp. zth1]QSX04659.1 hypothetical protein JYG23_08045 [Sedimentibacter sp. zth1]